MIHVIAWTGHRPGDLPPYATYQAFAASLDELKIGQRADEIQFVVGGALGVDTWAAEYALSRGIAYHLVLPFPSAVMGGRWSPENRFRLDRHIANAASVEVIKHVSAYLPEFVGAYQQRNETMVDRADYVFTLYTGKRGGGTYNCIRYALKVGKPVYNLLPLDSRLHGIKEIA